VRTERTEPARHQRPAIDDAALVAARDADRLLAGVEAQGNGRWVDVLQPIPDQLRDAGLADLMRVARRARAIYGPKDSIRDVLPADLTEPFLLDLDRLIKALTRDSMDR
jgi:hypothetical protein